jgi:hypothetical protein
MYRNLKICANCGWVVTARKRKCVKCGGDVFRAFSEQEVESRETELEDARKTLASLIDPPTELQPLRYNYTSENLRYLDRARLLPEDIAERKTRRK